LYATTRTNQVGEYNTNVSMLAWDLWFTITNFVLGLHPWLLAMNLRLQYMPQTMSITGEGGNTSTYHTEHLHNLINYSW